MKGKGGGVGSPLGEGEEGEKEQKGDKVTKEQVGEGAGEVSLVGHCMTGLSFCFKVE